MINKKAKLTLLLLVATLIPPPPALAETHLHISTALLPYTPSTNMIGAIGLNTVPSARMDKPETLRLTTARQGPYTHVVAGMQVSPRLFLGLRQTSESDGVWNDANRLLPGMDAKITLFKEQALRPEIAVGVQSAFGHKRMAGEYLALSKRYHNLDTTIGFGWGRMGTRQSLPNPVLLKSWHGNSRALDGDDPSTPADWFTGRMGVFAGIEYLLTESLSFKADWSSESWDAESRAIPDFKRPAPWSLGLSFHPVSWVETGIAWAGDTVMARVSFTPSLTDWPLGTHGEKPTQDILPRSTHGTKRTKDDDRLYALTGFTTRGDMAAATLKLDDTEPTAQSIARATRYLANTASGKIERIGLRLEHLGLDGNDVVLLRRDIENALRGHHGSAEEIWHNSDSEFDILPTAKKKSFAARGLRLDWQNDVSLSEEDSGILYRTALIPAYRHRLSRHLMTEDALRINLSDNITNLNLFRGLNPLPVRGDIDAFTRQRVIIDHSYLAGFATLRQDLHGAFHIGYLEEMYAGLSGEILYRPFAKPWAIGTKMTLALKRDPLTPLALGISPDHVLTGHINGYYEVPDSSITLKASLGRYLAEDVGGTFEIRNHFDNGVVMAATATLTNRADRDIYGGRSNGYVGMEVSVPFGELPFLPDGSRMAINSYPMGRDFGQKIKSPTPLYEVSDPLSYRHITRHWSRLTP